MSARAPLRYPIEAPPSEEEVELFGPYSALVPITVCGREHKVPEDNTLLRVLQYVELRTGAIRLDWGRYCWNDTKGCCTSTVRDPASGEAYETRACRHKVEAGLEVIALPRGGRLA